MSQEIENDVVDFPKEAAPLVQRDDLITILSSSTALTLG